MKKIFQLFVFLLFGLSTIQAQKVYFIYLQTDNHQPFFARLGEKVYNSTSSGYLILSNLRDSNYAMKIGVQGSAAPDQSYSIAVNRKDQGFLIKDFGEKGWGLFNLNTAAVITPASNPTSTAQTVKTEKREDNAFTNLLAKAADDSTIKERPIIEKPAEPKVEPVVVTIEKKEEPKTEVKENIPDKQEDVKKEVALIEKKEEPNVDNAAIQKQIADSIKAAQRKADSLQGEVNAAMQKHIADSMNAAQLKADSLLAAKNREAELLKQEELRRQDSIDKANTETVTNVEYKRSMVKLKSESSTTLGIGLVFLDMQPDNVVDTVRILIPPDNKKAAQMDPKQEEKKFLDITSVDPAKKDDSNPVAVKTNKCKAVATDDDFFKLRKKMVGENSDNNMISEAGRVFRTKCFTTTQIKNLGTLFLSDEYKYKFFDAAYQYVSDTENFASLQAELKDEYYINRFKAMLRF